MKTASELYPDYTGGYGPSNYQPIIDSFGEVLLQVDDQDYQGDSRVLYKDGRRYGLLIFGWGSCSGCDALQACDTVADVDTLIERLHGAVIWKSKAEMAKYLVEHDWEGDFSWHAGETREFLRQAKEVMGIA